MKCFVKLAVVFALAVSFGCGPAEPESPKHSFEFGLIDPNDQIVETTEIPFRVGLRWGWRLRVDPQGSVNVREVLTLPAGATWRFKNAPAPPEGGPSKQEDVRISSDGRVFTNQITIKAEEPVERLSDYRIISDDPVGEHRLEIFLDEKLVEDFSFTVVGSGS